MALMALIQVCWRPNTTLNLEKIVVFRYFSEKQDLKRIYLFKLSNIKYRIDFFSCLLILQYEWSEFSAQER